MPLQDAAKPSRRQILAAERKRHGAYDPVRLAKLLPPRLSRLRRSNQAAGHLGNSRYEPRLVLDKRDAETDDSQPQHFNLPPAPANSGAVPPAPSPGSDDDHAEAASPMAVGDAVGNKSAPPEDTSPTHNDTASAQAQDQSHTPTPADTSGSDDALVVDSGHPTQRTVGMVVGLLSIAVFLVVLAYITRRYWQKQASGTRSNGQSSKKGEKRQRLGSFDKLRCRSSDRGSGAATDDKAKSGQLPFPQVPPGRAGPFDRAIATMFSHNPRDQPSKTTGQKANNFLNLPRIATLSHQRSLDSIAEVQEPASSASTRFPLQTQRHSVTSTPKRLTWTDPIPLPSITSDRHNSTSSLAASTRTISIHGTPDSKTSKILSPGRPQSAHGGEIEMTRQGSKLVIRPKASNSSMRRLSSASGTLRGALRKSRGDGTICIDTDDIVDRSGGGELRSKFSSSTLRTQARDSKATTASVLSPAGSFSFEIKDAIRMRAPLTLDPGPAVPIGHENPESRCVEGGERDQNALEANEEPFVRDLDWDVERSSFTDLPNFTPPSVQVERPVV